MNTLKNYMNSLSCQYSENEVQHYTGNKIIDIIIHQKSEICHKDGIDFKFKSNNISFDFVDEADICCILSNLLDNAIEAARESESKMIEVVFYSNDNKTMFFIEITNSCDKTPTIRKDTLLTNKADKKLHGIGIYSVKRTLEGYSGNINYSYDEKSSLFKITVAIEKR